MRRGLPREIERELAVLPGNVLVKLDAFCFILCPGDQMSPLGSRRLHSHLIFPPSSPAGCSNELFTSLRGLLPVSLQSCDDLSSSTTKPALKLHS
jgi:hypothetical protein